jgi:hypothetical protein
MTLTDWTDYNSRQTTPGYRPAPESVEWEETIEAVVLPEAFVQAKEIKRWS